MFKEEKLEVANYI